MFIQLVFKYSCLVQLVLVYLLVTNNTNVENFNDYGSWNHVQSAEKCEASGWCHLCDVKGT